MRKGITPERFDPSISSAEYYAMACAAEKRRPSVSRNCETMLEDGFRFDLHEDHLADLLDPKNWRCKRPRVFISSYRNQSHNVEVRFAGGGPGIYFEKDFEPQFMWRALLGSTSRGRSRGELFWMTRLYELRGSEVDRLLLYGHKARLDEVIAQIQEKLDVVGAMPMSLLEQDGRERPVFIPDISDDELWAIDKLSQTTRRAADEWYE